MRRKRKHFLERVFSSYNLPLLPHFCQGVVLVYDITNESSFNSIQRWITNTEIVSLFYITFNIHFSRKHWKNITLIITSTRSLIFLSYDMQYHLYMSVA